MASRFKPTVTTYRMPDGSHRTPDGKRVTKRTPGAVKESRKSKVWYGKYKAADGAFKKVPLCADKTASKQMLAKMVTDARLRSVGLIGPFEEHHNRPLAEHLEDYRRHLLAKGNTPDHAEKTCSRIRCILDGCRFAFILDLSASAVAEFLHGLRLDPPRTGLPPGQEWFTSKELIAALGGFRPTQLARLLRRESLAAEGNGKARRYPRATVEALQDRLCRGIGLSTSNGYLTAIKGFSRWLVKDRRTGDDAFVSLSRLNAKTDVRHERRAQLEGELRALLAAAGRSAAEFGGLTGLDRSMLYALAMTTGFRASELASLAPTSFDLDADPPTATVKAAYSKNRRQAVQPLPSDVAAALTDGQEPATATIRSCRLGLVFCEDRSMAEPIGSDQPRFATTINHAIDLAEVGDVAQAVQLLTGLVAEFGEAASARGYLGWFLLQLGRQEEAIEQSRLAIRLAPGSEKASLIHFQVLWKSGKHIEALDEMKRFLTIRPSQVYTEIIKEWEPDLERDK